MAEDENERIDRELIELLNEVRVALPGVQVLFAFLLTLPFTQRFADLTRTEEHIFVAALLLSAGSAACLIAPTAHHRLTFRRHAKEGVLQWANVLVLVGVSLLAIAVGAAVYLAVAMVEREGLAAAAAALVTGLTALLWFAVPILILRRDGRSTPDHPEGASEGDS